MNTEFLVEVIEDDIKRAKKGANMDEDYPFRLGWVMECVNHIGKTIENYKEDNDE